MVFLCTKAILWHTSRQFGCNIADTQLHTHIHNLQAMQLIWCVLISMERAEQFWPRPPVHYPINEQSYIKWNIPNSWLVTTLHRNALHMQYTCIAILIETLANLVSNDFLQVASEQNFCSSHSKSIWNDSFEKLQRNSFFFLSISSKDHWYVGFFLQFLILLNFKQPQCLRTLQPFPVELIGHFDLIKLKIYRFISIYLHCNGLFVGYFN